MGSTPFSCLLAGTIALVAGWFWRMPGLYVFSSACFVLHVVCWFFLTEEKRQAIARLPRWQRFLVWPIDRHIAPKGLPVAPPKPRGQVPWLIEKSWRLPLFVFAFWCIPWGCSLPRDYALSKRGVTNQSTIVAQWPYKTHLAKCSYEVDGIPYSTCVSTPNGVRYSPDLNGAKVLITYDPLRPQNARSGDLRSTFLGSLLGIIPIVLMSLFVGYIARLMRREHLGRIQKIAAEKADGAGPN